MERKSMVILIVSVKIKPGLKNEYIGHFKEFAKIVHKEKGCIDYLAAIDLDSDFPPQVKDPDMVTVMEKWVSMQAFKDHLSTADMKAFGEKTKALVLERSAKVLQHA